MTDRKKILWINPLVKECGIYQFGRNIFEALASQTLNHIELFYAEVPDFNHLKQILAQVPIDGVILNHVRTKNSWMYNCQNSSKIVFIDLLHELPEYQNYRENGIFKNHLIANPDISHLNLNDSFYPIPRLIPAFNEDPYIDTGTTTVGGFSFGTLDRGWLQMLDLVKRDIPSATVRFHMPFNSVVDPGGRFHAINTANLCRSKAESLNIKLEIDHTFLPVKDVIKKLGQNTINLFLYQDMSCKTISSATDFALTCKRPFGINSSPMYSHFKDIEPIINVEKNSITSIIDRGTSILEPYYKRWGRKNFCITFEDTIVKILQRSI